MRAGIYMAGCSLAHVCPPGNNFMKPSRLFPAKHQKQRQAVDSTPDSYWTLPPEQLFAALHTTEAGLQPPEADARLKQYGPNALKAQRQNTWFVLLLSQFKSPLVLILIFAAIISAFVGEWTDGNSFSAATAAPNGWISSSGTATQIRSPREDVRFSEP